MMEQIVFRKVPVNILIFAIVFIMFGGFMLYVAFRNVFGAKEEPKPEIDPETGEEVLSGEVIETRQLQP